jgi:neutral ceramidase
MLHAGLARVEITPPLGTRLAGYGVKERPAEAVHDPLYATAVVFRQNDLTAAHVTLDVTLIDGQEVDRIRALASEASGIPAEHINVGVTHTHSSPQTFTMDGWGDKDEAYLDTLRPAVARAVAEAASNCVPVRIGVAETVTRAGINRRAVQRNGEVCFGGDEGGSCDPIMTVIRLEGEMGPVGCIIHCSGHCTTLGANRLISRDWIGVMVDRVHSQTRSLVMAINGAFGDVGPRTNCLLGDGLFSAGGGDGIPAMQEVGYLAAGDALRAHQSIRRMEDNMNLRVCVGSMDLPLSPLPPLEEARVKLAEWEPKRQTWGRPMCNYRYWSRVIEAHNRPQQTVLSVPQTVIGVGPVALVPLPGEPFSSISRRLRRGSPFQHTLACGGTNGSLCYLIDRESRLRGGYEPWVGISVHTQLLGDHVDDVLVDENLRLLEQMASQKA